MKHFPPPSDAARKIIEADLQAQADREYAEWRAWMYPDDPDYGPMWQAEGEEESASNRMERDHGWSIGW
jgi:hypothetical protein